MGILKTKREKRDVCMVKMSPERCGDNGIEGALSALEDSGRGGGSLAGRPSLGTLTV